ncbi:unnamed protein product [Mesocestoides corti]|uniref:HTH La-type RNA-binding domain-containing protein n=1 Tax=Mesocestoides corti TaxID=53468 RepID=A0A0R3UNZ5_MESCO|nr:unnamed protein product [Mesocestoides corti]
MKKILEESNGWLPFDILLKFKRLNQLSSDLNTIKNALADSSLVEVGELGVRRVPSNPPPGNLSEALSIHSDRALYVKGFPTDLGLDEIIAWIETMAGETYDVFCRRLPNKKFKGSIYVTFKTKEAAEKFMTDACCSEYKGKPLLRKWYTAYIEEKKNEKQAKAEEKIKKADRKKAQIVSQMTPCALLEISGLPVSSSAVEPRSSGDSVVSEKEQKEASEKGTEDAGNHGDCGDEVPSHEEKIDGDKRTVSLLKAWINEKLESSVPIAWIDVEPSANKAIIRFKEPNSASAALEKLTKAFKDGKIMYSGSHITGRVIKGSLPFFLFRLILVLLYYVVSVSGYQTN